MHSTPNISIQTEVKNWTLSSTLNVLLAHTCTWTQMNTFEQKVYNKVPWSCWQNREIKWELIPPPYSLENCFLVFWFPSPPHFYSVSNSLRNAIVRLVPFSLFPCSLSALSPPLPQTIPEKLEQLNNPKWEEKATFCLNTYATEGLQRSRVCLWKGHSFPHPLSWRVSQETFIPVGNSNTITLIHDTRRHRTPTSVMTLPTAFYYRAAGFCGWKQQHRAGPTEARDRHLEGTRPSTATAWGKGSSWSAPRSLTSALAAGLGATVLKGHKTIRVPKGCPQRWQRA